MRDEPTNAREPTEIHRQNDESGRPEGPNPHLGPINRDTKWNVNNSQ
jgi:hypothetical protein